jgi:hypothetical protein
MLVVKRGGVITFNQPGTPGRSYVLQASTNLTLWEDFGTTIAAGKILGFRNSISRASNNGSPRA